MAQARTSSVTREKFEGMRVSPNSNLLGLEKWVLGFMLPEVTQVSDLYQVLFGHGLTHQFRCYPSRACESVGHHHEHIGMVHDCTMCVLP